MTKEEIIKIAVQASKEYDKDHSKSRHDRRLRNTKLLLENYNLLQDHCKNAVYDKEQIINLRAVDALDSFDACDNEAYIESIKKSTVRTKIILTHIDEMLELYKFYCEKSNRREDARRYRVLKAVYFEERRIQDVTDAEKIDERTYYRDLRVSREKLSALIFGIDGLYNLS